MRRSKRQAENRFGVVGSLLRWYVVQQVSNSNGLKSVKRKLVKPLEVVATRYYKIE